MISSTLTATSVENTAQIAKTYKDCGINNFSVNKLIVNLSFFLKKKVRLYFSWVIIYIIFMLKINVALNFSILASIKKPHLVVTAGNVN